MENLTVPIGLTPKVKKGEVPDLKGIVVQELQYAFMARHYNLFEEEKESSMAEMTVNITHTLKI